MSYVTEGDPKFDIYIGKLCSKHDTMVRMKKTRMCRECHLEHKRRWGRKRKRDKVQSMVYSRLRQQGIRQACPSWADLAAIRAIYASRGPGQVVDHIVPLKGVDSDGTWVVCGLHIPANLEVVSWAANDRKWANWGIE
jgi:hypothetical protein